MILGMGVGVVANDERARSSPVMSITSNAGWVGFTVYKCMVV